MGDSIFAFIDPVSAVYNGGQAGYAHTKKITQSIITLNLTHTAPMDKYHLHKKTCIILYAYNGSKCLLRFFIS